jgi:hypothetical protein
MPKSEGRATEQPVFELRVELDEVRPAVWRQLIVPASIRLSKLADILLASMGWNNSHLINFGSAMLFTECTPMTGPKRSSTKHDPRSLRLSATNERSGSTTTTGDG